MRADEWITKITDLVTFEHIENAIILLENLHSEHFAMCFELYTPLLRHFYDTQQCDDVLKMRQLMAIHGVHIIDQSEEWRLKVRECELRAQLARGGGGGGGGGAKCECCLIYCLRVCFSYCVYYMYLSHVQFLSLFILIY